MKIAGRMEGILATAGKTVLALSLIGLVSGCSSMALEDAAPRASATQPDGFPNLNVPVQAASPQITESERQQLIGALTASRQSLPEGVDPNQTAAETERLRRLARQRAEQRQEEGTIGDQSSFDADRLRRLALTNAEQSADRVETSNADRLRRLALTNAERNADRVETSSIDQSAEADRLNRLLRSHADSVLNAIESQQ